MFSKPYCPDDWSYLSNDDNYKVCKNDRGELKTLDMKNFDEIVTNAEPRSEIKDGKIYNGKGKVRYDRDRSNYQGEFKDGKKNGTGIYITYGNISGTDTYEGKFKDDVFINGKYYINNKLIYEGEFKDGKQNGTGIGYYNDIFKREGQFKDGFIINGKEYKTKNNEYELVFEGEFKDDVRYNGTGKENNENDKFEGEYKNGIKYNGTAKQTLYNIVLFDGQYINGKKNGTGIELGSYFYSDLVNGRRQQLFKGEYKDGLRYNGTTKYIEENKYLVYSGNYKDGKLYIKTYNKFGDITYEGGFVNNKKNGFGKDYYEEKHYSFDPYNIKDTGRVLYEGEFLNDLYNGHGKVYNFNGSVKYEGEFETGFKINNDKSGMKRRNSNKKRITSLAKMNKKNKNKNKLKSRTKMNKKQKW